jgi:hypothetical protein
MIRNISAAVLFIFAAFMPTPQAVAQDPLGGAIIGGAVGGIIGGAATGRAGGAVAGAIIGGATGAIIASEGRRYRGGYYWWHGNCYYRYPNGDFVRARRSYCY